MPKTLTVDDAEIRVLQIALQRANADHPPGAELASLTAKVAALSDPDPLPEAPATAPKGE